jgi:hypothetical protein
MMTGGSEVVWHSEKEGAEKKGEGEAEAESTKTALNKQGWGIKGHCDFTGKKAVRGRVGKVNASAW